MRWLQYLGWLMVAGSIVIAYADLQGRWIEPGAALRSAFKLWIFWGTWATLPLGVHALWLLAQNSVWHTRLKRAVWAGLVLLVAYSGLVEPRLLPVRHHAIDVAAEVPPLRLAVVSDVHAGLFVRDWQLRRLVNVLNAQDVDAVVVAGDWTYNPKEDLALVLQPLQHLRHPVFAVLGNHDTQAPGPPLEDALRKVLLQYRVQVLDGAASARPVLFNGWRISGLSDAWGGDPRSEITRGGEAVFAATNTPHLIIAHNPDTASLLPPDSAALVVSGHTHGGQIMLPWITRQQVLPAMSAQGWYEGLYRTPAGPLFVASGMGTIGLPARLGVAPRVDVLRMGHAAPGM
ncbi:MAG: metallophosphoesterase [Brachymonas sp.]|nr:metallophosphoesterase [Brachymonas sp.]